MIKYLFLLSIIYSQVFCYNHFKKHTDRKHNKRYLTNNAVLENFISIYNNLAQTTFDAYNTQRRCFTIMMCGVQQLMAQNGEGTFDVDVAQPADVIASEYRSIYDLIRITLDPAINLVQASCGSYTSSEVCEKKIHQGLAGLKQDCAGFENHWRFYEDTAKLVDDKDYIYFKHQIFNATIYCSNDDDALEFLDQWQNGRDFSSARHKMINWYKTFVTGSYPCYLPPLEGYCSPDILC